MISPANSQPTLRAAAKATELTAVIATPATSAGRRPTRSVTRPSVSIDGINAATYTPNSKVTIAEPKWYCR